MLEPLAAKFQAFEALPHRDEEAWAEREEGLLDGMGIEKWLTCPGAAELVSWCRAGATVLQYATGHWVSGKELPFYPALDAFVPSLFRKGDLVSAIQIILVRQTPHHLAVCMSYAARWMLLCNGGGNCQRDFPQTEAYLVRPLRL